MEKRIGLAISKFILGLFFLNYIILLLVRHLTGSINSFVGFNRELVDNPTLIEEGWTQFDKNVFVYYISGLFGNWGTSIQTGGAVSDIIRRHLLITGLWFFSSIVLIFIGVYGLSIYWGENFAQKVMVFSGNWFLYSLVIILPILVIISNIATIFLYDGYTDPSVFTSSAFYMGIVLTVVLGIAKLLSEMTLLPINGEIDDYAEIRYPQNGEDNADKPLVASDWNSTSMILVSLKGTSVFIMEIYVILEVAMNIPGIFRRFIQSVLFFDLAVVVASLFYVILFVLLARLVIDILLLVGQEFDEQAVYQHSSTQISGNKDSFYLIGKFTTAVFVTLVMVSTLIWLFTGFYLPSIPFFHTPTVVNVSLKNLSPFASGTVLGTDYLGRDIFAMLVLGTSVYLTPLVINLLIRPPIIIGVSKIRVVNVPKLGEIDLGYHVTDLMQAVPKIPFLMVIFLLTVPFSSENSGLFIRPIIYILSALIFWGWAAKYYMAAEYQHENGKTLRSSYLSLVPIVILSTVTEVFLIGFSGFSTGSSLIGISGWPTVFLSVLTNFPTRYMIQFLGTFVFVLSFFFWISMYGYQRIRKN